MKKFERGFLLFLVLVLALSTSVSYLALFQASKSQNNKDEQKMTIALVNEDQGANFKGKKYEFGSEFIKNIEKDDKHNWYVVSRGVAENGIKHNSYNMMIVIPNDFSEKALSIDSKAPEKVVLNYKVNASGNNNMKVRAEKTANTILRDFNRRIIDVYFASVIGNLQDAQDNITSLVKKEHVYTNVYNNAIHRPLSGYTTQLGLVQSSTKVSKDGFKGLQDILKEFENNLGEGVKTSKTYQTSMLDYAKLMGTNALVQKDFSDQLGSLDRDMNNVDVLKQLENIVSANDAINEQFQINNEQTNNITSEAVALKEYLAITKEKVDKIDTELTTTLASDMQQMIAEKLKKQIKMSAGEEQDVYLNRFFSKPDEMTNKNIQKQIDKLIPLSSEELINLGITEPILTQINNVAAVTNKYKKEFNYTSDRTFSMSNQVADYLVSNGSTISDSVHLPSSKEQGQEFTLSIPQEYKVNQVLLTLPNKREMDYTKSYFEKGKIVLPATSEGKFTVRLNVQPKNNSGGKDLFQPVEWNWKIHQKNVTDVDIPVTPKMNGETAIPSGQRSKEIKSNKVVLPKSSVQQEEPNDQENNSNPEQENEKGTSETANNQEVNEENKISDPNENEKENTDHVVKENSNKKSNEEIIHESTKKVEIENNYISHTVMSPLTNVSTSELMNDVSDIISNYQKMLILFNNYFGLNMSNPDLVNQLKQSNLKDMATTSSLYYLFNKQDIVDVLANFVAEQIIEEVREKTEELKTKMDEYIQLVNQANQSSEQMTNLIKQTSEQAADLNTNLSKTLLNLATWREASLNLQNEQSKIVTNSEQEQSAIITLDTDFSSLLNVSQSIAEQSKSNLVSANSVYKTFDSIDNQAKEIKNSGSNLVKQANDLSSNLTDKLVKDQKFADNFADVLANSRIGERQNENLLSFLSNPVETKNSGMIIAADDVFTPYFVVLICFIISLFTAYVISNNERKNHQVDTFEREVTLIRSNTPITIITVCIGIVEGLLIGLLSGYFLEISQGKFMLWIGYIIVSVLTMLLVATYLLRQLKMLGMFILLLIFSLYLFLTEALGLHFDKLSAAAKIREFSPIQYIENLVMGFADHSTDNHIIILSLFAIIIISLVGHLFVFNRFGKGEEKKDEGINEAH
ncbi:type VII secretion protein EsaA [Heyndrickxia sporothermodurans]